MNKDVKTDSQPINIHISTHTYLLIYTYVVHSISFQTFFYMHLELS